MAIGFLFVLQNGREVDLALQQGVQFSVGRRTHNIHARWSRNSSHFRSCNAKRTGYGTILNERAHCCSEVTSIGMAAGIMPTMPQLRLYAIIFTGHRTS